MDTFIPVDIMRNCLKEKVDISTLSTISKERETWIKSYYKKLRKIGIYCTKGVENLDGIKNLFNHINQSLEEVKCEKEIACLKDGWGGYFVYVGTDQKIEEFSKNILL